MKTWSARPTRAAVEAEIQGFFDRLRAGDVDGAEAAVAHAHPDWASSLWSLWQDTHLVYLEEIDEEVDDDSFEGRGWLTDRGWLAHLAIEDEPHWDDDGERLYVNVIYRGEVTDVSAEFRVVEADGGYVLRREVIHVA